MSGGKLLTEMNVQGRTDCRRANKRKILEGEIRKNDLPCFQIIAFKYDIKEAVFCDNV